MYVTLNAYLHDEDLSDLPEYLAALAAAGVDAFIVSDLGVFALAREHAPQVDLHISTQASVSNVEAARMWHRLGAKRIVTAREMSLEEIAQLKAELPDVEVEVFVQGAMSVSYTHLDVYKRQGITWKGTRFGVTAVPLGGYAAVCGMGTVTPSPHLKAVLGYMYAHGTADMEDVADALGITDDEAYQALEELTEWGSLKRPTRCLLYTSPCLLSREPSRSLFLRVRIGAV